MGWRFPGEGSSMRVGGTTAFLRFFAFNIALLQLKLTAEAGKIFAGGLEVGAIAWKLTAVPTLAVPTLAVSTRGWFNTNAAWVSLLPSE